MALQMQRDYRLRWMDFDRYGRLQPAAVLDLFQDMAVLHAEELGIGRDAMLERNVVWVVVRTKMEIVRQPSHFQVVTVRTWPHSLSKFSFIRDFALCDEDGELLAKASQEWVLMDVTTRKFASAKDSYTGPTDFCEERMFPKKARKAPSFDEGNRPVVQVVPGYTDIDVNGHVNNAMYADYIVNAYSPGEDDCIKTLQIDYRYEVLPNEPLALHTLVEGNQVLVKALDGAGTVAFAAVLELA